MHIAGLTRLIYNIVNIGKKFKGNLRFSGKFMIFRKKSLLVLKAFGGAILRLRSGQAATLQIHFSVCSAHSVANLKPFKSVSEFVHFCGLF
jgi:hypothetical protein